MMSCVASWCTHGMTPNGGRPCPPRRRPCKPIAPTLTEADVRRLIAHTVSQPPRVVLSPVRPPTQMPAPNAANDAVRPLPAGPPPPERPAAQLVPPSRGPNPPQPESQAAAPKVAAAAAHGPGKLAET